MKTQIRIEVSYKGQNKFVSTFALDGPIDEYIIADRAWDEALTYAQTIGKTIWGRHCDMAKIGEILRDIDYNYSIEEMEN